MADNGVMVADAGALTEAAGEQAESTDGSSRAKRVVCLCLRIGSRCGPAI